MTDTMKGYWGKANPTNEQSFHPLVFHSLDVAAVGQRYLTSNPKLLAQFSAWLRLDDESTLAVMTFALALHDLGKFAENFQFKRADIVAQYLPALTERICNEHHDAMSVGLWWWMSANPPAWLKPADADFWHSIMIASFGHHGAPPKAPSEATLKQGMSETSRAAAMAFCEACAQMFLPVDLKISESDVKHASWWIAGLAVLADWLGSNTDWFHYATPAERKLDVAAYWHQLALPRAALALQQSGVVQQSMKPFTDAKTLLQHLRGFALRPAQMLVQEIMIATGPQLFFLEDATGSGKTEAALILAARLIDAGLADGLYFGLPTMATADQMFDRVTQQLPEWFEDPQQVSAVLAHGARDRSSTFKTLLQQSDNDHNGDAIKGELDTASLRTTVWLADSNKRALQAQIGVGTLDQALFSALRVKHQSLRLLGLFRKVLIVDEVHSYDSYMSEALCAVLAAHAYADGCVILVSATMSKRLKASLLRAFQLPKAQAPKFRQAAPAPFVLSNSYPLLTQFSAPCSAGLADQAGLQQHAFAASAHSVRSLDVRYVSEQTQVLDCIRRWAETGQSVVWIRNTIKDAIATYELLAAELGVECVTLFHSRFSGLDRQRIQNCVLQTLGKRSTAAMRAGKVFVCTQVLQESLDVDADQMISDLTVIDVLLQRFGRYRRHPRDRAGNPLPGGQSDGRSALSVLVYGPERTEAPSSNWYRDFSSGSAMVYAAHGEVWRTAQLLDQPLVLPGGFRNLVEAVYGDNGLGIPEALQRAQDQAEGNKMGDRITAQDSAIKLSAGYEGGDWDSEERIRSRLGDSLEAVLLRLENGKLVPWALGKPGAEDVEDVWPLSQIRLPGKDQWGFDPESQLADRHLQRQVDELKAQRPALKYRLLIPMQQQPDGRWQCEFSDSRPICLRYCDRIGLDRS